jgi:hypothetical protein
VRPAPASAAPAIFEHRERPLTSRSRAGCSSAAGAARARRGAARIDPETGENRVDGNMIDLGGASFQGRARVTGEPLRPVRIELPATVLLRSRRGRSRLSEFVTDLPPVAMLDANGVLEFAFGARLTSQGARGGDFPRPHPHPRRLFLSAPAGLAIRRQAPIFAP